MSTDEISEQLSTDAIECLRVVNDPEANPRKRAYWAAWLGADPRNQAAYFAARDAESHLAELRLAQASPSGQGQGRGLWKRVLAAIRFLTSADRRGAVN